jgi:hypothetical protein
VIFDFRPADWAAAASRRRSWWGGAINFGTVSDSGSRLRDGVLIALPLAKSVYNQLYRFVLVSILNQPVRPSPQPSSFFASLIPSLGPSIVSFRASQLQSCVVRSCPSARPNYPAILLFTDSYDPGIFACHKHPEVQKFKPQALQLAKA